MGQLNEFIDKAGVFFLATEDGDQAKVRPLGMHVEVGGKVYFGIGDFKDVYKQLKANPKCEIVACKDMDWLRYTGKAVFEPDDKLANAVLEQATQLKDVYNEKTGYKLMMFHLEDAEARIIHVMGEGKPVEC
ncbi:MAG: pyridoxamine 5'-phosphate oxidase family protein [Coriobacteriales bacterium]|jgi:uncharacterized pyridoxamine 5'-phosphate oxidase family protein